MASKKTGLGTRIDALYELRSKRLELEREAEKLKAAEEGEKTEIIRELQSAGLKTGSGTVATFTWYPEHFAMVKDPIAFRAWLIKTKRWELASLRPLSASFREIWESDDAFAPPGVSREMNLKVSLTKAKKR